MSANTAYDYVVIGGGHNGLVAANYLVRAGASVAVIEQRPYLGGLAASQPYIPTAPKHILSKGAIDAVFIKTTSIIDDLDLARHGLSLIDIEAGYGWTGGDGETLCIFSDVTRTGQEIARFSKADAKRYLQLQHAFDGILKLQLPLFAKAATAIGPLDLVKAALRTVGDREARKTLAQLATCSAHEAIAVNFESDPLRSLYAYWCEIAGPADIDGSALNLASLALIHRLGVSRPRGGMGGFIAALERSLASHGADVITEADVTRILVDQGRARGVCLADSREIHARRGVLATCAPQITYQQLLAAEQQNENSRARVPFLPANANNMCPFKVDMAVAGPLRFGRAQRQRNAVDGFDVGATSLVTGSFDDHIEHAAALRLGRMGRRPPTWMTVLSHADSTLAPSEQSVAYLYTSVPMLPEGDWGAQANSMADELIANASRHLDGLDAEIGRLVTTPADFERQYLTPRGCLYHVDMLPTRMLTNRPASGMGGCRTEIEGLYLAGSGSHPGGGVFGMPGRLAAAEALKKIP